MWIRKVGICLVALLFLGVTAVNADTTWTINNATTTSGGTVSGYFNVSYSSTGDSLGSYDITYTGDGTTVTWDSNGSLVESAGYLPGYGNGTGCDAACPPAGSSTYLEFDVTNPLLGSDNPDRLFLYAPYSSLPDLGTNAASVTEDLCTTTNDTGLCVYNTSSAYVSANDSFDNFDPGTITGSYIAGTPSPTGTGGGGTPTTPTPEPSSLILMASGLGVVGFTRKFRKA